MSSNNQFNSKIGLIAATVGSAVGLGNIWRFPAETQANGGAAFLIVYIACVLILGVPVMLGEFTLGRAGGSDAVTDFRRLAPRTRWWMIGAGSILVAFLINIFYMVVAGWTLEYFINSISGNLFTADTSAQFFTTQMQSSVEGSYAPAIFTIAITLINISILLLGVQKGIERMSNLMMPALFLLLIMFCIVSLSLPGASGGVEFFMKPDFSKINSTVIINALGQAFFSLSLGMGILITYAAYFPRDTKLTRTAVTVSLLDMLVAVMVGLVIFPAIVSFGMHDASVEGTSLVFVTMPMIFTHLPCPALWSSLFFFLLLLAAATSTISISEVPIRYFQDTKRMSRRRATLTVMLPILVLSAVCSLSLGPLSGYKLLGMNMFDLLNTVTTNYMLPLIALFTCIYLGWFSPRNLLSDQLTNGGTVKCRLKLAISFIIKWIAPALIALIFISQFL